MTLDDAYQWFRETPNALDELLEIKAENDKLRSECDYWRVEQVHAYSNWEDTYKYAVKLKAENAKLRELVREYAEVSNHLCTQLEGCSQGYAYCKYYGTMDGQCKLGKLNDMAREIGTEVAE